MMGHRSFYLITLFSFLIANEDDFKAKKIMEKVISQPNPATSISEVKLEIVRKRANKEKRKFRAFIRYEKRYKNNEYFQKSLVKFLEPKSVKGTGLLSWTKEDGSSDQWFFLPKLKMAKKVKSKEKSKSFMSTDFIYEDLENRNLNDDIFKYEGQEIIDGNSCVVISSAPIKDSSYKSKKIFVDTKIFRARKVEYFSENLILEKTLFFKDIVKSGKYWIPKLLEMKRPNGNYTIMNVKAFKPDADLDDAVFSESFLIAAQ